MGTDHMTTSFSSVASRLLIDLRLLPSCDRALLRLLNHGQTATDHQPTDPPLAQVANPKQGCPAPRPLPSRSVGQ